MRYFPRARKKEDISVRLKVCPECLGDLVRKFDVTGLYYVCMQCHEKVQPNSKRTNLPLPVLATLPGEFFPEGEPTLT
jgi:hypothetical protein